MTQEPIPFPVRINRYLALKGIATRRAADDLISAGRVRINGKRATLGDRVEHGDVVDVAGKRQDRSKPLIYLAYYKPRGVVTHSPTPGQRSIADAEGIPRGVFPMGRLDKESEGLIILTNDGRVTERLLHPRFEHEKEYVVQVREKVSPMYKKIFEGGVVCDGEKLTAKEVSIDGPHMMTVILTEGKKHQIRRMCAAAHLTVDRLKRVRVMDVRLGPLGSGKVRALEGRTLKKFLADLGLPENEK